jgi:hypothetical protein
MTQRKNIPDKIRLKVLKRDNFTCQSCGKSPALYPELEIDAFPKLEIDHFQPHSKQGSDDIENLQTLCILCNRGKGNDDTLNQTIKDKIDNLLNTINPEILKMINSNNEIKIVANDTDYQELSRLNDLCNAYDIRVVPNSIFGYQAMHSAGIYTAKDNYAGKVNFILKMR